MHKTAQELARLGRNGDTMLMHVQPSEVAGLQALAKSHGTTLTTNPHTGMPEAFNMRGAVKALAPTALGLAGAAVGIPPVVTGLVVGGLTAAKSGNVMQGAMAGLGAYGGGELGGSLMGAGAGAAPSAAGMTGGNTGLTATGATHMPAGEAALNTAATGAHPAAVPAAGNVGLQPGANALSTPPSFSSNISNMGRGAGNMLTGQPGSWDAFTSAAGGEGRAALQLGAPAMAGLMGGQEYKQLPTDPGYDPNFRLNLSGPAPLRLAGGGAIDNAGISGLYGSPDNPQGPPISQDGYGLGRLDSMAMNQQNNRFAKGGYLDGAGDGMSDSIPAKIDGKQPAALADGEFVIPADVVSHIGNGSTKAGAHRLYDMLAKIRKARTGNSAQGKQINPRKFMPA